MLLSVIPVSTTTSRRSFSLYADIKPRFELWPPPFPDSEQLMPYFRRRKPLRSFLSSLENAVLHTIIRRGNVPCGVHDSRPVFIRPPGWADSSHFELALG